MYPHLVNSCLPYNALINRNSHNDIEENMLGRCSYRERNEWCLVLIKYFSQHEASIK